MPGHNHSPRRDRAQVQWGVGLVEGVCTCVGKLCILAVVLAVLQIFFLLTSQGYGQNPQQIQTPVVTHRYPDAGRGCMGGGAMEGGFMGGGQGSMQVSGTASFCYGCRSWGFSYPVSAF